MTAGNIIRRPSQWCLASLWSLLAGANFVGLTLALLDELSDHGTSFLFGALTLYSVSAVVSYILRWRPFRALLIIGGVLIGLYAVVLVLFGTEDVGGPWVSFPAGALLGIFAVWSAAAALFEDR